MTFSSICKLISVLLFVAAGLSAFGTVFTGPWVGFALLGVAAYIASLIPVA